jgi:outer membrane immunogenic protein
MKKLLIAAIATAAFCGAPALAAPPAAPMFNWTGFYVGGNVGYGSADSHWDFGPNAATNFAFAGFGTDGSISVKGWLGGAQAGYNWSTGQMLFGAQTLIGIEGTWDHSDIKGSPSSGILSYAISGTTWTTHVKDLWTAAARFGITEGPKLVYLKAGVAGASVDTSAFRPGTPTILPSTSASNVGWIVGFGAEYMFTPNWTIGGEYNYADLGSGRHTTRDSLGVITSFNDKVVVQNGLLRLSYKFGGS